MPAERASDTIHEQRDYSFEMATTTTRSSPAKPSGLPAYPSNRSEVRCVRQCSRYHPRAFDQPEVLLRQVLSVLRCWPRERRVTESVASVRHSAASRTAVCFGCVLRLCAAEAGTKNLQAQPS
jgi:hypothetical protein